MSGAWLAAPSMERGDCVFCGDVCDASVEPAARTECRACGECLLHAECREKYLR